MKRFAIALALCMCLLPAKAQVVINVRRPTVFLMVEGGMSQPRIVNYDNRAQGIWHPYAGIGMDLPMTAHLNMVLRLTYLNKSYSGVATADNPTAPPGHDIHSVEMGLLQFHWYPFRKSFYLGAGLTFGGNFLIDRVDAGTRTRLKANDLDALGLTMGYALETGLSLSFWPVVDRITFFARYSRDFLGSPFSDGYLSAYGIPGGMRCSNLTAGVRIPLVLIRD